MKATAIISFGAAVLVGVLGALQIDHFLQRRDLVESTQFVSHSGDLLVPTQYSTTPASQLPDFRQAAKKVMPSVVSVDRYEQVQRGFFDDSGTIAETGTGSGVIVSANGVIVTNNHVVQGASQVKVRTSDKRTLVAQVLGTDPRSDLAVLKVTGKQLPPIEMGNSSGVEVGEWVMAVGNPLGFDDTVSVGVVSSLKRDLPVGMGGLVNAIQTDAAINPGNSGGALTDATGRLIGINSAIASSTGQSVGIGFAIPVDRVRTVVNDIVKLGYARYAGLGVSYDARLDGALSDPDIREQLAQLSGASDPPEAGIIVRASSGPAANAGIGQWDVLMDVDGVAIDSTFSLNRALINHKPGEKVAVKYWQKGRVKTTNVVLQEIHVQ